MNTTPNTAQFVPLAEAAQIFGYRDVNHFRSAVVPLIGLRVFKVGNRWVATKSDIESTATRIVQAVHTAATPSPTAKE